MIHPDFNQCIVLHLNWSYYNFLSIVYYILINISECTCCIYTYEYVGKLISKEFFPLKGVSSSESSGEFQAISELGQFTWIKELTKYKVLLNKAVARYLRSRTKDLGKKC